MGSAFSSKPQQVQQAQTQQVQQVQTQNGQQVQQQTQEPTGPTDAELLQQQLNEANIGATAVSQYTSDDKTNTTAITSDTFSTKDLTGKDVPENYVVKAITSVVEFIPYTKHRATTGSGVELYWLEGEFRGEPCKFTVSYSIFKELPDSGAVPCNVEIVQTTDEALIATHFQFSVDAYEKLTKK